jgi:hypothetical protein
MTSCHDDESKNCGSELNVLLYRMMIREVNGGSVVKNNLIRDNMGLHEVYAFIEKFFRWEYDFILPFILLLKRLCFLHSIALFN